MQKYELHDENKCLTQNHQYCKWRKLVGVLACLVVFGTVLALMLPAHTLEKESRILKCPLEVHRHTSECYDEENQLICGQADYVVHLHSEDCRDDDGNLICQLPEIQSHEHTADCYSAEGLLICGKDEMHRHAESCYDESGNQVCGRIELLEHVHDVGCFETVKTIENIESNDNAEETESIETESMETASTETESVQTDEAMASGGGLCDDDAIVSKLKAAGVRIVSNNGDILSEVATADNGDTLVYSFSVETISYTDTYYDEGRVKFEFVLPFTEEQAVFDLSAMTWMDNTEGYAPVLKTEFRMFNNMEVTCQVLTGYKLLQKQQDKKSAIPGDFTETVPILLQNMEHGAEVALQISSAMEYSAWDDVCEFHQIEEKLTIVTEKVDVADGLAEEKQRVVYENFLKEIEALIQRNNDGDDTVHTAAEELRLLLQEASEKGELTQEHYKELYEMLQELLDSKSIMPAEAAEGTNWMTLRDSGWFEAFSDYANLSSAVSDEALETASMQNLLAAADTGGDTIAATPASNQQVSNRGGTTSSADGAVAVSKTISGTELENVFDITLKVTTSASINAIEKEPDMAVVIVLDISNSMNSDFAGVTRYAAAMDAAEDFLDRFAENGSNVSQVGFVAFNREGKLIFDLQTCSNKSQAAALKNTMRAETGRIINAENYAESKNRFTNIEGGLNRAKDMLNRSGNRNKYIIFLSDGFPTTYTDPQYRYGGYSPIDPEGKIFKDRVKGYPCTYGTSYSDEAAIRARKKAEEIKNSGITIFSIGVDVGGQTIKQYIDIINDKEKVSAVDRTSTKYEIGSASSATAYQNWLRNKIGSGYYYDSTNIEGLKNAYDQIYNEIVKLNQQNYTGDWITTDPVPTENIEYIGFYDKKSTLMSGDLQGTWNTKNGENTASFNSENSTITWDLSKSGCVKKGTIAGGDVIYTYQLVYRVRLKNENSQFVEGQIYETNKETTLTYRNFEDVNGSTILSERRTINYKIPSVHGYVRNIEFMKTDSKGNPLSGAEFKLSHDTANCSICRGDGASSVTIPSFTATSDSSGTVSFNKIPSGHKYVLVETKAPDGYGMISDKYYITVDYDKLSSMTVESKDGIVKEWDKVVVNRVYHELPETGGPGTLLFILSGLFMVMGSLLYGIYKIVKEKRRET